MLDETLWCDQLWEKTPCGPWDKPTRYLQHRPRARPSRGQQRLQQLPKNHSLGWRVTTPPRWDQQQPVCNIKTLHQAPSPSLFSASPGLHTNHLLPRASPSTLSHPRPPQSPRQSECSTTKRRARDPNRICNLHHLSLPPGPGPRRPISATMAKRILTTSSPGPARSKRPALSMETLRGEPQGQTPHRLRRTDGRTPGLPRSQAAASPGRGGILLAASPSSCSCHPGTQPPPASPQHPACPPPPGDPSISSGLC